MRTNFKKKNKGMTMVETLAAFTILIILSLSFLAVIHFASRMSIEADDRRKEGAKLDEALAKKTTAENGFEYIVEKGGVMLKETSGDAPASIKLDNCEAYMLSFPDTSDTKVAVMRFEYKE